MPRAEGKKYPFKSEKEIDTGVLEVIDYDGEKQLIELRTKEFSAVCPFSGLPDIGEVIIKYIPNKKIIELKSLKYYFVSFRNVGIYQEKATDRIFKDLKKILKPKYLYVETNYNIRGGIEAKCIMETKKYIMETILIIIFFITGNILLSEDIKYPNVAGSFYPLKTEELEYTVDTFISKAHDIPQIKGKIYGILVPHAGYIYSGAIAGYGYKIIEDNYEYVILLSTSHTSDVYGLQTCLYDAFLVPNGKVFIDKKILKKLIKKTNIIKEVNYAYFREHAVEVQLPFLIRKLKIFKLLPFVVSNIKIEDAKKVAEILYEELKYKKILIIISTDFSHYPPSFIAEKADKEIIDAILLLNSNLIEERARKLVLENIENNLQTAACGEKAIIAGIEILKRFGANKAMLLKYSHSGKISGDNSRVVGYAAIAFYSDKKGEKNMNLEINIDNETKKRLLKHARQAINHFLKTGEILKIKDQDKILDEYYGVFVTLKKHGELRGCIGITEPILPLREGIPHFACSAAFNDPRFYPVKENELKDIDIEISILSKPQKIKSVDEIIMKKHGVIVKKGNRSGLFLPQVAEETGWSKEEFLSNLCSHKAGLPPDAWKKDKDVELYIFTVYAFSEKELR